MSRSLDAAVVTAIAAPTFRPFLAVELLFASGATRANTTPINITVDGNVYLGVGNLGRISQVEESGEIAAQRVVVGMTGIDPALISLALAEHYQGRRGTIWYGLLDADHVVIGTPIIVFRGRMDVMPIELGETATITVTLESRLADWERPRGGRLTDEEQRRRWPDDRGLEFVSQTVEKEIIWGGGGTAAQPMVMQQSGGGGGGKK